MAKKARVLNMNRVNGQLQAMSQAMQGKALGAAAQAGMLIIINDAKVIVHKVSGNLARSLHVGEPIIEGSRATVRGGTNVEYAATEEFGNEFRPPHPYLRPAYDNNLQAAKEEAAAALADIVRESAS
jgi:HK97 gp10 family phage protein